MFKVTTLIMCLGYFRQKFFSKKVLKAVVVETSLSLPSSEEVKHLQTEEGHKKSGLASHRAKHHHHSDHQRAECHDHAQVGVLCKTEPLT